MLLKTLRSSVDAFLPGALMFFFGNVTLKIVRIAAAVFLFAVSGFTGLTAAGQRKPVTAGPAKAEVLPTGMSITPTAARGSVFRPLNPGLAERPEYTVDHPVSTAISPDGGTLLILTSGFNRVSDIKAKSISSLSKEYVFVFDLRQTPPVQTQALQVPNTFEGLAWAPDGKSFYVSGGADDKIHVFVRGGDGRWAESGEPLALGHKSSLGAPGRDDTGKVEAIRPAVAGLAVSPGGGALLAANYQNDSVSLIDLAERKVIRELDLRPGKNDAAKKGIPGGEFPYGVVFQSEDKAYVSSLRDREIVVLRLKPELGVAGRIKVKGQPGKMLVNKSGSLLFAVADNSDSVVVVNTANDRVVAEIRTTTPAGVFANPGGFKGSNPNSLALSPDEKTLYVTNGGTNSVAVIRLERDVDDSQLVGLIPTGWYPTSVSADEKYLYVVNGKSVAGPNPHGCRNTMYTKSEDDRPCALAQDYVLQKEKGGFLALPRPSPAELHSLTLQVAVNNHFVAPAHNAESREIFDFLRQKIRHVIYIVKENRSYDQVLGDLKKGNGDRKLTLFPDALAPNHHSLARDFVTLDNFYASGSVSGDGWNWSLAARATDFVERTIPINYGKRGINYDVEGENRGINVGASSPQERRTAGLEDAEDQLPGGADVAAPDGPEDESGAGFLWDSALRSKLTIRNYGFWLELNRYWAAKGQQPEAPRLRDPAASSTVIAAATNAHLQEFTDPYFRGFDMSFPDYWRFREWEREFDEYVKKGNLPSLELVRLCHDHLGSFSTAIDGVNTVETQLADNDYAVGLLVEKVAHSPFGKDTLIFVIEDDAQNGPDHVDAHRTVAYVIGPYVKKRAVVSSRFNTVSMLRTMEEVLGIRPLGLNDALQGPMAEVFSTREASWTYTARVPAVLRSTELPVPGGHAARPRHDAEYWAKQTEGFDFSVEDKLDVEQFNRVLWKGLKGDAPYPEGVTKP